MSHLLWKAFWEDDVDRFRRLLAPTAHGAPSNSKSPSIGAGFGSPGALGTSPRPLPKSRKAPGFGAAFGGNRYGVGGLGKAEVNARDHVGLTILLRASSNGPSAVDFARTLLEHPAIDIYVQDPESGWNALHRALYAGNVSIARLLLEKERRDITGQTPGASVSRVGKLIKTKDHEGNSPFDLYNSTIGKRSLAHVLDGGRNGDDSDSEEVSTSDKQYTSDASVNAFEDGDELFAFGSNKNLSLGLGDEDDRQYPERVFLQRPDHLLARFYEEYLDKTSKDGTVSGLQDLAEIPILTKSRPLIVHDVVLSKLHSAVLTTDPVSNLYVCGVGRGGRLGLGDENTRFSFTPVQGGLADKKVVRVALGQNHTMAVTYSGELWTWGSNTSSQLGYVLPPPMKTDEEPMTSLPRQVFGLLKKEKVVGVAASTIHSVAHTETSLYCWGRNVGQLALMDADSRSLETQQTPRKVAASLFSSPIVMVSAIDKATTCLLANHTVCVFTSYGYNIVKFPLVEAFSEQHLSRVSMSTKYDPGRNQIEFVTSGGETIAAVTSRGDLFTMNLIQRGEHNTSAASTTNPSKIKGAVSQPQCIWSARKDGVRSVGVGEHGSVIISTQSGAVWRRVKRAKAKDSYVAISSEIKRKDFKFQRVPSITKVVAVRSSVYGAFAAIRRDVQVMAEQLRVSEPTLWNDVAPLLSLHGFSASDPSNKDKDTLKYWNAHLLKERLGPVAYEVLKSPDLEMDLQRHLKQWKLRNEDLDLVIRTTSAPDIALPAHGWILSARSSLMRSALREFRRHGSYDRGDGYTIKQDGGIITVTFVGLDLLTILNLLLYIYEDKVIPAWNYARQAPSLAHRYRQVRAESMKLATRLGMSKLEAAVRLQVDPKRSMLEDFRAAIEDLEFFEDGDAVIELDGGEAVVHSALLRQRCPWFESLFNGRSRGMWLASRRENLNPTDRVRIDMKHVEPGTFHHVLRYLYADIGEDLFDPVVSASLDDLSDLIMDVMSIANELMLDRLSQICQQVIGRFVTTKNVAHLLNAISPCTVTDFKDAGLEYICLQVEAMLENHHLDDLDEDLLLELDEVVRANQIARYPYTRSASAKLLHERYPHLAQDIDEERQRRVREMAFKVGQNAEERKFSTSFKGKIGSLDDLSPATPPHDKIRRKPKTGRNEPFSPDLRPKASQSELIFSMDEEETSAISSPLVTPRRRADTTEREELDDLPNISEPWRDAKGKVIQEGLGSPVSSPPVSRLADMTLSKSPADLLRSAPARPGKPWGPLTLPTTKLDLRDIMTEDSTKNSALSASLAAQKLDDGSLRLTAAKLSQKERKKQQQLQASQAAQKAVESPNRPVWDKNASEGYAAPWKLVSPTPKTGLKELISRETKPPSVSSTAKALVAVETSRGGSRRPASPDTRFSGQSRATSTPTPNAGSVSRPPAKLDSSGPVVPHSRSYLTRPTAKAGPSVLLSMADIIGQQQREQEMVREASAKRSLQEIQQEQAFQEWWDQESRRTQEEEATRQATREAVREASAKKKSNTKRGRPGKSRGGSFAAVGSDGSLRGGDGDGGAVGSRVDVPPGVRGRGGRGRSAASGGRGGGGGRSRNT